MTKKAIIIILLALVAMAGQAQSTFDTGDGCLNVIDVSYAQGIGVPQTTYMRSSLTNASASEPESDTITMRSTSFLQFPFISVHITSFLTSGFLRLLICALEDSLCSMQRK